MFDNEFFEKWLDDEASKAMSNITTGNAVNQQEMMVLILKAQTNHIRHMEQDLHNEMVILRQDMDKRFEQVDKRFEQVDKRFEQVIEQSNKRFEQVDKRFDMMINRMDKFLIWSFSNTFIAAGIIIAAFQYLK